MKTIKQIADELNISKDKVKYQVRKLPDIYLVKKDNVTYIKNEGVQQIREILIGNHPGNSQSKKEEITHIYPPLIDVLQDTISTLQQQLSVKDKQIEKLQAENEKEREHSREQANRIAQLADQAQRLQLAHITNENKPDKLESIFTEKEEDERVLINFTQQPKATEQNQELAQNKTWWEKLLKK